MAKMEPNRPEDTPMYCNGVISVITDTAML